MMKNMNTLPYNSRGRSAIEAACLDPIAQAVNFGIIRPGVALSAAQEAQLLSEVGQDVSAAMNNNGWYLLVEDVTALERQSREARFAFWYMDGGSMQKFQGTSTVVL